MWSWIKNLRCSHHYGPIANGYQVCTKCGLARSVKCAHFWEHYKTINTVKANTEDIVEITMVRVCRLCGEIKSMSF
jgi:hypothetical protein